MGFILIPDLHGSILAEELEEITRGDIALITSACDAAEEEMKLYLFDSYETESIFAQTGTNRHRLLLICGVDMAIYHIVARCQIGQEIDDRKARYDRSINMLKMLQKSETYANIPRRAATAQTHIMFGSNNKRKSHY
jgi:Protein of unknown function (DUF1320)